MVDTSKKQVTRREARARCMVLMQESTLRAVMHRRLAKGNVLTTAKVAGILAAKKTAELIPLCHPLFLEHIDLEFRPIENFQPRHQSPSGRSNSGLQEAGGPERRALEIISTVTVTAKTGAEMEALQAVAQAALTVYDMCKALERGIIITDLQLVEKRGGKSGTWKLRY